MDCEDIPHGPFLFSGSVLYEDVAFCCYSPVVFYTVFNNIFDSKKEKALKKSFFYYAYRYFVACCD